MNKSNQSKRINIKCAQCEKEFEYYSSKFRPFCSERCKMIDLGHWMSESYAVPSRENLSDEDISKVEQALNEKHGSNDDY